MAQFTGRIARFLEILRSRARLTWLQAPMVSHGTAYEFCRQRKIVVTVECCVAAICGPNNRYLVRTYPDHAAILRLAGAEMVGHLCS
jgi:hypothetical protein